MKKFRFLAVILSILFLTSCVNQVNKEKSSDNKKEAEIKQVDISNEEAWKKEPMYGKTILVGYNGGLCTGSPGLAKALGYFEKEGLDVKIVNTQTKSDAVGTNKVQLTTDHIATLLVPAVNGVNMIFTTSAQTGCKSLYVLKDGPISSTKDLVGKIVAVPDGIGNSDHNIALRFFNHDHINPNDVNFRQVETSATILAMQNNEVQAAVLSDQFAEKFINEGKIKAIRSLTWDEDFKKEPCCVHAFNKTFVEENPITAAKMTKAIRDCQTWINGHIEEATQALFDNNWASGDFDQAVRMMKSYNWDVSDEDTGTTLKNIINDYKTFGLIDKNSDTQQLLAKVWIPLLSKNK